MVIAQTYVLLLGVTAHDVRDVHLVPDFVNPGRYIKVYFGALIHAGCCDGCLTVC